MVSSDEELNCLRGFSKLRRLHVPGTRYLGQPVYWNGTPVTNAPPFTGPNSLKPGMDRVEVGLRYEWKIRVTDDGLRFLEGLTSLKSLELGGSQVTDAGMENLKVADRSTITLGSS